MIRKDTSRNLLTLSLLLGLCTVWIWAVADVLEVHSACFFRVGVGRVTNFYPKDGGRMCIRNVSNIVIVHAVQRYKSRLNVNITVKKPKSE
jgi:hypothetical protein